MNDTLNTLLRSLQRSWNYFVASTPRLAVAVLLLVAGIFLARFIGNLLGRRLQHRAHDPLMGSFLGRTTKIVLIVVLCMLALRVAGLGGIAAGLLATAGASAVVLGFAFKNIAENFIAGVILAFNRPFHIDDTIQIDDVFGKVKAMQSRYTQILTFDGRNIYIPNADVLNKPVINFTENGFYRMEFLVGVAYENNLQEARKLIQAALDESPDVVHDEEHVNFVTEEELGTNSVNLRVFLWVPTDDFRRQAQQSKGRVIQQVKDKLEGAGLYLPCNVMELKTYTAVPPVPFPTTAVQENTTADK